MDDAIGAAAKVDGGGGEGFVHGHEEISGAQDSAFRAEGPQHGFTESDSDVFHGVVLIDVQITFGGNVQIKSTMAGD